MNRRHLESHANISQIAGFTRAILSDGLEGGVEIIEMRSGAGLRIGVCPSRGLDVVFAELNGVNLTWRHPNGAVHPAFYGADNFDWLRGAPNGLVTTCGLQSFGPPAEVDGEKWGIHDRIGYLPAREIAPQTIWHDDDCEFRQSGIVRQTRLFGANLELRRTLTMKLGENRLQLRDEIRNAGFEAAPFCVLYHCNFGYPLLEKGAQVLADSQVTPRDEDAARGLEHWARVEAPLAGFQEQVFFHDLRATTSSHGDGHGEAMASAALWNPARKLGVRLNFARAQLPYFTQWKMLGAGAYVMGLEPSNAPLASRAQLLQSGEMPMLNAGESRQFEIEFDFVTEKP